MPPHLSDPLYELIEGIGRQYEQIFDQFPAEQTDGVSAPAIFLYERARAFKNAGDLIAGSINENQNLLYAEMLPAAVFLYRHAIELNLKSIRSQLADKVSREYQFGRIHDLLELWRPIEDYLTGAGFKFEDGVVHYRIARAIKEFSNIDVDGQLFRYPDSSSPAAANWIQINLVNLRLSATEVDILAFGFHDLISVVESMKEAGQTETTK